MWQLLIVFRVLAGACGSAIRRPEDDLLKREATLTDGCYGCFEDAACALGISSGRGRAWQNVPWSAAHCFIFCFPKMVAISIIASTSSLELKNGKRRERIVSRMTPADHISISAPPDAPLAHNHPPPPPPPWQRTGLLVVWWVHLKSTSGALNPLVPALFARRLERLSCFR